MKLPNLKSELSTPQKLESEFESLKKKPDISVLIRIEKNVNPHANDFNTFSQQI